MSTRESTLQLDSTLDDPSPASPFGEPAIEPRHAWYVPVKSVIDTLVALVLLVLSAPIMAGAALAVRLTSRGPIFYHQTRLGLRGREFTIYKLRTMVNDAEAATGPVWCGDDDPRVTRVGRLLRRTHIDELPQLFNILCGHMSLIGPRPERPELVARLLWRLPGYSQRLNVKPGLTGFAQVRLPPDAKVDDVRLKLAYDLYYVRHAGPWLDARILFFTATHVLWECVRFLWLLVDLPQWKAVHTSVPVDLQAEIPSPSES